MQCQKDKFQLRENITFINGAYMSPILTSVIEAGHQGLLMKTTPSDLTINDFFGSVDQVRELYSKLINVADPRHIAVAPSASYVLSNVARNIPLAVGEKVLVVEDQFPSNFYAWKERCKSSGAEIVIVKRPSHKNDLWSDKLLSQIDHSVKVVSIPQVHWADGSVFDLIAISDKVHAHHGYLVIDGTQSIGAFPFDNEVIKADVVLSSVYKWLLGPYGSCLAYYNDRFDSGQPIEDSWMNRKKSDEFRYLTEYQDEYRTGARRYEQGESSDFIKMPMIATALQQLLEWGSANIQNYCKSIVLPILPELQAAGYTINERSMAFHLFGIRIPQSLEMQAVQDAFQNANISVSYRGDAIRVSPNVYNTGEEMHRLKNVLLSLV